MQISIAKENARQKREGFFFTVPYELGWLQHFKQYNSLQQLFRPRIEELHVQLEVRTGPHRGDVYLFPTHYWFLLLLDEYQG